MLPPLFTTHELAAGAVTSDIRHHARTLSCQQGQLWVTLSEDKTDYFLEAGMSLVLSPDKLCVIEAASLSRFTLTPDRKEARFQRAISLLQKLRGLLRMHTSTMRSHLPISPTLFDATRKS
ncbi:DUF2917 domain-containing protein [Parvibium lacunae]|nr:DUF2917 domain-containing protein [Parvibium lacunae]